MQRIVLSRRARLAERRPLRSWSRWTAAVIASAVFHATVAAALWDWKPSDSIWLPAPQAGRASIALTASMTADAAPAPREANLIAPSAETPPPSPAPPEEQDRAPATLAAVEAAQPEAASLLLGPTEPVLVVVDDAATPVVAGGQSLRRVESIPAPPPLEAAAAQRPLERREFAAELAVPSTASIPSPGSVANDGVETDDPPQVVVNRPPVYPPEALAAGKTGRVVIRAEVAADGRVTKAQVHRSSGVVALDQAALAAVRDWRFAAAANPDNPPRRVNVPIDFVIRR
jgi:protein TonB